MVLRWGDRSYKTKAVHSISLDFSRRGRTGMLHLQADKEKYSRPIMLFDVCVIHLRISVAGIYLFLSNAIISR